MTRVALLLCGCLTFALCSFSLAADKPSTTAPAGRTFKLQVVDAKTKQPLGDVAVSARILTSGNNPNAKKTTDDQGLATIDFPLAAPRYVSISVTKKGYVPMSLIWGDGDSPVKDIPDTYTLSVEPGTTISGKVLDDAKQPVAGATVVMHVRSKSRDRSGSPERVNISYKSVKTADDGTWHYDVAPSKIESLDLGVHHPLYPTDSGQGWYSMSEFKDLPGLRDGTATLTLKRGPIVRGTVFGPDDKPLAGAKVGIGGDRVASNSLPEQTTDAEGHFSFGATPDSTATFTVKAKGLAPDLKQVSVSGTNPTVEFHLQPGKALRGRVVDSAGKPIAGVTLYADTWRSARTLDTHLTTDADGRFKWDGAPADAVQFDIYKAGYADNRNKPLTAGDQEVTITLNQPLKVHGTVVDADTGKPVENFTVIQGISWGNQQPTYWERRNGSRVKPNADGKFEYDQTYPYPGLAVRIEADGYLPAESRIFTMNERDVAIEFKLAKGKSLAGIVKAADGKPAEGAKLVLATPGQMAYIRNNTDIQDQGAQQATTDATGRYSFPPQTGPYVLVVLHDAGYAEVSADELAKSADITLASWGKLDGTITVGSKPGADSDISVQAIDSRPYDPKAPRIYHHDEAKADANGHFSFDRIAPGKVSVSRTVRIPTAGSGWMSSPTHTAKVDVQPNQVAQVQLGGTGRPVVGRVVIPSEVNALSSWFFSHSQITTKRDIPRPETPTDYAAMTTEQKKKWYEDFMKSDKGKAYQAAAKKAQEDFRSYAIVPNRDGSFHADDIPAGTYTVNVTIAKPQPGSTCGPGDNFATATTDITIPEMPNGRSDEPLDVGTLNMTVIKSVNVGDAAPDFAVKTIGGREIKLADYKGKYVLLDFWATWCGPCVAETPSLKEAYNAFAANPKFAMIGLSLDEKATEPKTYAEKNDIKWTQGFLGDWSKDTLTKSYGVQGIPSIWLIGPDGKVLAKNLRGDQIKSTLAQHLAQ